MLSHVFSHDARLAICSLDDSELQGMLGQLVEVTVLCFRSDYTSAEALLEAAEEWLSECVCTILAVWGSILPGAPVTPTVH